MRGVHLTTHTLKRFFATVAPKTVAPMANPFTPASSAKCVLAPMVRTGELPTRLLALKYGADLVWGPETVDKAIISAIRTPNAKTGTIDFVKPSGGANGDDKIIFRTLPSAEKGRLIFQLGTASKELAVEAAMVVKGDVDGIDVNSGCPKHFSIHAGMGAALLSAPDKLCGILTALVEEVGRPYNIPISVKIRLLDPPTDTLPLVERLCTTGITHLTVHCRTIPMRPRDPAIRTTLSSLASICHSANVTIFANGDVTSRPHALELCQQYGLDGCMIARAAEENMSVFREEGALGWREVAQELLRTAVKVRSHVTNTKFCLGHVVPGKEAVYQGVSRSKTHREMCEALGVVYDGDEEVKVEVKKKPNMSPNAAKKGPGKVSSNAVKKAKGSETVRAAGGGKTVKSGKKSPAVRGVGAVAAGDAAVGAMAEREQAAAAV